MGNLSSMFGDVRFVCMGGSHGRAEKFAHQIAQRMNVNFPAGLGIVPIGKTERYSMFKVGPIISVNHGMGMPSMSILLHEMTKLLYHARAKNVSFMRIGTSGGVGVAPGTIVVTTEGVNGKLEPYYEQIVLGREVKQDTGLSTKLVDLAISVAEEEPKVSCVAGKTIGTHDFYEGQGRFDGAVVSYSAEDRAEWLRKAHEMGVRNIEMESTCFAAWCNRTGITGMILCAALLNRLEGDQVTATPEQLHSYSAAAQEVALRVIERCMRDNLK